MAPLSLPVGKRGASPPEQQLREQNAIFFIVHKYLRLQRLLNIETKQILPLFFIYFLVGGYPGEENEEEDKASTFLGSCL